jgi:LPXTG-motif cell wall-anchored protein
MSTTGYTLLAWLIAAILALCLIGGLIFFFKYRRKRGEPTKPDGQLRH